MTRSAALCLSNWQITWHWHADRLAHVVRWFDKAASADLQPGADAQNADRNAWLTSLESSSDDDWPLSPPLQSIHCEARPGGAEVALLVGMAGESHWSASVEADPAQGRLLFDIACRLRRQPRWLGSTYRPAAAVRLEQSTAGSCRFVAPDGTVLTLSTLGDTAAADACRLEFESGQMRIVPQLPQVWQLPATVRWKYQLCRGETPTPKP